MRDFSISEQDPLESLPGLPSDPTETVQITRAVEGSSWSQEIVDQVFNSTLKSSTESPKQPFSRREQIGEGGRGEVWSAIQVSLDRLVAIKTIQQKYYDQGDGRPDRLQMAEYQFSQEALIAGMLEHPNIVPVYDQASDDSGRPLLAMKLVKGQPWDRLLKTDFEELSVQEYLARHLPIFIDMMQAVAFAHSLGVVHRDLKPSQVMVGEFGEVLLIDWGLAVYVGTPSEEEDREDQNALRHLPTPVTTLIHGGTPAMMAPEQTLPHSRAISRKTDVFLLGGTLYRVLTGEYPYSGGNSSESIVAARKGIIVPPEERVKERYIPEELSRLAMSALSAEPDKRPDSVLTFIREVESYLAGSSLRRQSYELVETARKEVSCLRETGQQFGPEESAIPTASKYELLSDALHKVHRARGLWSENEIVDEAQDEVLETYVSEAIRNRDLRLARSLVRQIINNSQRKKKLLEVLEKERQLARQALIRRSAIMSTFGLLGALFLGFYFYTTSIEEKNRELAAQRDSAESAKIEAEKARIEAFREQYFTAVGSAESLLADNRTVKARQLLLNRTPAEIRGWEWWDLMGRAMPEAMALYRVDPADMVLHATYRRDGAEIVTGDKFGRVIRWDSSTGNELSSQIVAEGPVWCLEYSPNSEWLVATSFDGNVYHLDSASLEVVRVYEGHEAVVRGGTFTPDGSQIVSASRDGTVRFWDLESGEMNSMIEVKVGRPYDVVFSGGGERFLVIHGNRATIYDSETHEPLTSFDHHDENILGADFDPQCKKVVLASTDRTASVCDARSGEPIFFINNSTSWLHSIDWSPNGDFIVTGDNDGVIRVWDSESGHLYREFHGNPLAYKVEFSPDSRHVLVTSNSTVCVWDYGRETGLLSPELADLDQLGSAGITGRISVFSAPMELGESWFGYDSTWRDSPGRRILNHGEDRIAFDSFYTAFSPDGRFRIETDPSTLKAAVLENQSGERVKEIDDVYMSQFLGDNRLVILTSEGKTAVSEDATWSEWRTLGPPAPIPSRKTSKMLGHFSVCNRGLHVLRAMHDGSIILLDIASGEIEWRHDLGVATFFMSAFSPDGSLCAVGGFGSAVIVMDSATGEIISTLRGDENYVLGIAFSPDNTRLVTATRHDRATLWDVSTGREIDTVFDYPDERFLLGLGFNDEGNKLFAATSGPGVEVRQILSPSIISEAELMTLSTAESVELIKRRQRLNPDVKAEDIDMWQPVVPREPKTVAETE